MLLVFYTQVKTLVLVWMGVFILADFGEAMCSLFLAILAIYSDNAI